MKLLTEQYAAPKSQTRSLMKMKLKINEEFEWLNGEKEDEKECSTLAHS